MKTLSAIVIGLMACLAIGISTARGQQYTLEDLGVVKGMEASDAAAINNQGHVAGTAYKGQQTCAFHYDYFKKIMEDAGGLNSRGFGINSWNIVVGDALFPSPMVTSSHAAMFKGGVAVDLGLLKGQTFSRANGINTVGQIVGYSGRTRDGANSRAFMWSGATGMVDIGTLGGAFAQAYAINDTGFITGTSQMLPSLAQSTHAFLYGLQPAGAVAMRDLGVLGGYSSFGTAINNYNHVVGYSTIKPNDQRVHAFLHDGKSMIDLGTLGGNVTWGTDFSVALGVNNIDQVVGYTYLSPVSGTAIQQVAFLWNRARDASGSGRMVNLNSLLDKTGRNYLLLSATGINDKRQIAATAYDTQTRTIHAVLLIPLYQ